MSDYTDPVIEELQTTIAKTIVRAEEAEREVGKMEREMRRLSAFIAERYPEIQTAVSKAGVMVPVVDIAMSIIDNCPSPDTPGHLDPHWVPKSGEDMETMRTMVVRLLIDLQQRTTLNHLREELLGLYTAKGHAYTDERGVDSCYKRAWAGIFENMMRKVDRLETISRRFGLGEAADEAAQSELRAEGVGEIETVYVTLRDLAIYAVLAMRYVVAQKALLARGPKEDGDGSHDTP